MSGELFSALVDSLCKHKWGPAVVWMANLNNPNHHYWGRFCAECHQLSWSQVSPAQASNRETRRAAEGNRQWVLKSGGRISDEHLRLCRVVAKRIMRRNRRPLLHQHQSWIDLEDLEQIAREALVNLAQNDGLPREVPLVKTILERRVIDWLRKNGPQREKHRVCPYCNHQNQPRTFRCEKCDSLIDIVELRIIDDADDYHPLVDPEQALNEEREREEEDKEAMGKIMDDLATFLPPAERKIITAYRKGWDRTEISKETGMTPESVWTVRSQAIRRLRAVIAESERTADSPIQESKEMTIAASRGTKTKGLTQRELQVISFASQGCSLSETANKLSLSEETVKTHRKKILVFLQAKNLNHAIGIAFARGILPIS